MRKRPTSNQRRALTAQEKRAAKNLRRIWDEKKGGLHLTQEKAGHKMTGISQGAVSHYLNGTIPLNLEAVFKFADLLQVDAAEIGFPGGQWSPPKVPDHDAEATIFNDYFRKLPTESRRFLWMALRLVAETVYTEDPEATVTRHARRDLEKLAKEGERLARGRAA